jgi:hypothetical protein
MVPRLTLLFCLLVLAGCGGGERTHSAASQDSREKSTAEHAEDEEAAKEAALARIPVADRHAYYRLATAAGILSRTASVLAVARLLRARETTALRATRPQVIALRPSDPLLARLRVQLIAALDQAIHSRRSRQSALRFAPSTLSAATAIVQGLTRYARSHPAVSALVPD